MNVKEVFFSERELKKTLRDTLTRAAWSGAGNFLLVRSEHAHASYPGLFFRPPGFSPYKRREERRVQVLDYIVLSSDFALSFKSSHWSDIKATAHFCSLFPSSFTMSPHKSSFSQILPYPPTNQAQFSWGPQSSWPHTSPFSASLSFGYFVSFFLIFFSLQKRGA